MAKNGKLVGKTINKEAHQISEATFNQERQDLWDKLDTMENFGIAARGLALAVEMLVHQSIMTKGEVTEWFLTTSCLYEE